MNALEGLLTVDCGNSTIDCRRSSDGARLRLPSNQRIACEAVDGAVGDVREVPAPAAFDEAAALRAFTSTGPLRRCALVSVVAAAGSRIVGVLRGLGIDVRCAGSDLPCPLPLDYETPHTLGADRWVGALAAHRQFGRSIVVDCGSATTVNLVEGDGTFRGGAIAPGLRAMVAGLAAVTPALPAPDLEVEPVVPPRATQAAVDAGVLLGYRGLVERLVADTLRAARGPATVVVTGGNASRLLRGTRLRAQHVPDLVHRGLQLLAEIGPWSS